MILHIKKNRKRKTIPNMYESQDAVGFFLYD